MQSHASNNLQDVLHAHALTHCHCQYTHTMSMLVHDTAYVLSTCVIIIHLIHTCYLCDTTCAWTLYIPYEKNPLWLGVDMLEQSQKFTSQNVNK